MEFSVEAIWRMPQVELLATYHAARRLYAEKKFARDTERGRLQWQRARAFANGNGSVTERIHAADASEELARKGQLIREMSHELELKKADIDVLAATLRLRGMAPQPDVAPDQIAAGEQADEPGDRE